MSARSRSGPRSAPHGRQGLRGPRQGRHLGEEGPGHPYLFGGDCKPPFNGTNRCDCSSLVNYAWSTVGVNLPARSSRVPTGTPIRAVGPGTVVTAGWSNAYGYQVVIKHADGKYSPYAHQSKLAVSKGQKVSGGSATATPGHRQRQWIPPALRDPHQSPDYRSDIDPLKYLRSHRIKI